MLLTGCFKCPFRLLFSRGIEMIEHIFPSVSNPEEAAITRRDGGLVGLLFAGFLVAGTAVGWMLVGTNPRLSPEAVAGARETLAAGLWVPVVFVGLSLRVRMAPDRVCAWLLLMMSLAETVAWIGSSPENYTFLLVRAPVILAAINGVRGAHASKRFSDAQALKSLF
jgi:hypothetical protein